MKIPNTEKYGGAGSEALLAETRANEVKALVEAGKAQIVRDLIMKRYAESKEDEEKWFANFDSDLESYVRRRVELALLERGTP